ncbi:MAG: SRPBCC family protein [Rhodanobacteraceae bacterium]|nr:SRPBCC family protein [Rhodanobacteraceae bacterium]
MVPGTVTLHRVLRAPAERIYRAFIDPAAMVKWLPPNGFTATVHSMDARVGGSYQMSFTNFGTGSSHSFGGTYLELVPGQKLRYNDQFDNPDLPGQMEVTVTLRPCLVGTDLRIVQQGIPDAIPVESCYAGWQESLILLGKLVEAEIPDGA